MVKHKKPLTFSDEQIKRLRLLGVNDCQINQLGDVLRICKSVIDPPVPNDQVKSKLERVHKTLQRANKEIERFLGGKSDAAELALQRFEFHEWNLRQIWGDDDSIKFMEKTLHWGIATERALNEAISKVQGQARYRSSSFFPIQRIDEALRHGHNQYHQIGDGKSVPHYLFDVSLGKKAQFPKVAKIFYTAMGIEAKNLERPIKSYQSALKNNRRRQSSRRIKVITSSQSQGRKP